MSIEVINSFFSSFQPPIDEEEKRIMRRLKQYGIKPSGKKSVDKAKLHEIELKEAQQLNYVTNKFLTVTKMEQEKIQDKKKVKRKENNPELDLKKEIKKIESKNNNADKNTDPERKVGATALGEQMWLSIQMKNTK